MLQKIITTTTLISLCLLIVLLNVTNPVLAGPFGILSIFVLSYLSSLGVMTYFIYGASLATSRLAAYFMPRRPLQRMSFKRSYYYSTILAAVPIMLVGLQSVGAIGFYELFLVTIFAVIGCLYISKRSM